MLKNSLITILLSILLLSLSNCKKSETPPPTLSVSTQTIDLGSISSNSLTNINLSVVGSGTITYTISSSKTWLKLGKTAGSLTNTDAVSCSTIVPSSDLIEGANNAIVTIVPTINGNVSNPITITITGTYKTTTLISNVNNFDFGTISKNATSYITLKKSGTENISFKVSSDNPWLTTTLNAPVTVNDSFKFPIIADVSKMIDGNQSTNLIITPSVNGVSIAPIQIAIKANFYNTLINGLVAYYPFNGNADDQTANPNNGFNFGAVLTSDRFGNPQSAYSFNGYSNNIKVANSDKISNKNFTYSFWVYMDKLPSYGSTSNLLEIGSIQKSINMGQIISINYEYFNTTGWFVTSGNTDVSTYQLQMSNPALPVVKHWYNVTLRRSDQNLDLYIDTKLINSVAVSKNPYYASNPNIIIGSRAGDSGFFAGIIDDLRIYNRAITEDEINQIYNLTK